MSDCPYRVFAIQWTKRALAEKPDLPTEAIVPISSDTCHGYGVRDHHWNGEIKDRLEGRFGYRPKRFSFEPAPLEPTKIDLYFIACRRDDNYDLFVWAGSVADAERVWCDWMKDFVPHHKPKPDHIFRVPRVAPSIAGAIVWDEMRVT
jgi:hypothetical protein